VGEAPIQSLLPALPGNRQRGGNTQLRPVVPASAQFEYTGATALTAVGPITGRRYRFPAPGAIVEVNERDAPSLAAVPHLRRIRRWPAISRNLVSQSR